MTGNRSYLQQCYRFNTERKTFLIIHGILSGIITDVFLTKARWPTPLGGERRSICVCCIGEHCPSTASMSGCDRRRRVPVFTRHVGGGGHTPDTPTHRVGVLVQHEACNSVVFQHKDVRMDYAQKP